MAISRSKVKIWVVPTGTAATALVTTAPYTTAVPTGYIAGEIKNYALSGGGSDVESEALFGGFADKEKPEEQYEVAFELRPDLSRADLWESMVYGYDATRKAYTSAATKPANRCVFIEADDLVNPAGWGFNNCNITTLEMDHPADDNMTKNLTLKFSPTDINGKPNFIFNSKTKDTTFVGVESLPAWSAF